MSDLARFNIDTMSGVFPGTRTMVYQRVRIAPCAGEQATARWVRVLWYDEPPACVVELAGDMQVRLADPLNGDLGAWLRTALADEGWQLETCGTCAFWRAGTGVNDDGLATGACHWAAAGQAPATSSLGAQSLLAPACIHWQPVDGAVAVATPLPAAAVAPIQRRALQETDERWTLWGRLRRWASRWRHDAQTDVPGWEAQIVERSGVGAGTEPCFACQGRIANLGALTVATPEGDRQTYSVWRCRSCYACYLNDWIDRWERTDSLETEEIYYRLAPAEALEVLAVIAGVAHAEHPARRHTRDAQRTWMLAFLAGRTPLSHQIKQGR